MWLIRIITPNLIGLKCKSILQTSDDTDRITTVYRCQTKRDFACFKVLLNIEYHHSHKIIHKRETCINNMQLQRYILIFCVLFINGKCFNLVRQYFDSGQKGGNFLRLNIQFYQLINKLYYLIEVFRFSLSLSTNNGRY